MKSVRSWCITVACLGMIGGIVMLASAQSLPKPGFDVCVIDAISAWQARQQACEAFPETDPRHSECEVAATEALDADYEACIEVFLPGLPPR